MMTASYTALDGNLEEIDLDAVVDVVDGWSNIKSGWQGFIIYSPADDRFVELLSTVPNVRGDAEDKAVEVNVEYVLSTYLLTSAQISELRSAPSQWIFLSNR